ncbi:hypothetical protein BDD12DRAFT_546975 [Trichophaea hybrida]|nr:hypothetical protein BDD12DRAFT_546975 [Trichophaea hybrida]
MHRNQQTGYKYICTPGCADLRRALPNSTANQTSPEQQLLGNILRSAAHNGIGSALILASRIRTAGLCKCQGESADSNCLACKKVPTTVPFSRSDGLDGSCGPDGSLSTMTPRDGPDGIPGSGRITVRQADGSRQSYMSKYTIELVSFQVTDENDDGIIEPGEYIYIERIVVHNKGGMPTPSETPIPVMVRSTEWIQLCDDLEESTIYLPVSIPAGHKATSQGRVKAFIKSRVRTKEFEQLFCDSDTVSLKASMPGVDMDLPGFSSVQKTIKITYPLILKVEENLQTVSQGSRSTFSWKVHNNSTKPYGELSPLNRKIFLSIKANTSTGIRFPGPHATETSAVVVVKEIQLLYPGESVIVSEEAEIDADAQPYSIGSLATYLHLSPPFETSESRITLNIPPVIQAVQLEVQISSHYGCNRDASFLLVTNSDTSADVVRAWRAFIGTDLGLKLDIWNLSLYGSMDNPDDEYSTILAQYAGKSVIMLCNGFDYFSRGQRTVMDFSEPLRITEEVLQDTRVDLILSSRSHDPREVSHWIHDVVFPISATDERYGNVILAEVRCISDIVESVSIQSRSTSDELTINAYTVPLNGTSRWQQKKLENEANKALRFLAINLPQERFCIKPVLVQNAASLVVFRGLSRAVHISARPVNIGGALNNLDRFGCINSLSFGTRLGLLSEVLENEIFNGIRLSTKYELLREVNHFLGTSSWPDTVVPKAVDLDFLELHFKRLYTFLCYYRDRDFQLLPDHATEALQVVLSATHSQDLLQFSSRILMPIKHRRT